MENDCNMEFREEMKIMLERRLGHSVLTSRDFSELSDAIQECTKVYISAITLRRFWGNLAGGKYNVVPRQYTLDALASYVGYHNWNSFIDSCMSGVVNTGSDYILDRNLSAAELCEGTLLEVSWAPDRAMLIRSMGNSVFCVVENLNGKLSSGDVFRAEMFVEGEPLLLTNLVHQGGNPTAYICGKIGGIRYRILDKEPVM